MEIAAILPYLGNIVKKKRLNIVFPNFGSWMDECSGLFRQNVTHGT